MKQEVQFAFQRIGILEEWGKKKCISPPLHNSIYPSDF